jgi:Flp pilus assembly protein TadG
MSRLSHYLREERGAAAAELGIFVLVLTPIVLNLVDIGVYVYKRMQVENAAQAGAQAAWATCDKAPANSTNCPYLSGAVSGGVQGTSLGAGVTWTNSASYLSDAGYYCPDGTNNALVASSAGATCTSTGASAGYYVKIIASYAFSPLFTNASVASLLPSPITYTTWTRLL